LLLDAFSYHIQHGGEQVAEVFQNLRFLVVDQEERPDRSDRLELDFVRLSWRQALHQHLLDQVQVVVLLVAEDSWYTGEHLKGSFFEDVIGGVGALEQKLILGVKISYFVSQYLQKFRPLVVAIVVDQVSRDFRGDLAYFVPELFGLVLVDG
jgi:hypothetical protein